MLFLRGFYILLIGVVFFGLSCSDEPPVAPSAAGKANCALCEFLGDERFTFTVPEAADADSTESDVDDGTEGDMDDGMDDVVVPDVLTFADEALKRAVRETLDKPYRPLTAADISSLTVLKADDLGIESLEGLQYWTALDTLELRRNRITDLSPLARLTNLRVLHLWGNDVEDLSPLAGLTNLRTLGLWGNAVKDVSPLASLSNLRWVQLGGNEVEDVTPLAELTRLRWVGVVDNPLGDEVDVSALTANGIEVQVEPGLAVAPVSVTDTDTDLIDVQELRDEIAAQVADTELAEALGAALDDVAVDADGMGAPVTDLDINDLVNDANNGFDNNDAQAITDLDGIEVFEDLEDLNLEGTLIDDFAPLADLPSLRRLELAESGIDDAELATMTGLDNVRYLDLRGNDLADLTDFPQMAELCSLVLAQNALTELSGLSNANVPKLKWLEMFDDDNTGNVTVAAMQTLPNLSNLEYLNLSGQDVDDDLAYLFDRSALKELNLNSKGFNRLDGPEMGTLPRLESLEVLRLKNHKIGNFSFLSSVPELKHLDMSEPHTNSLSGAHLGVLSGVAKLEYLNLAGNESITGVSSFPSLSKLDTLILSGLSNLDGIPALRGISLKVLDISGTSVPISGSLGLPGSGTLFNSLTELNVSDSDANYSNLSSFPVFPELKVLNLSDNSISSVSNFPTLPKLAELDLRSNSISNYATQIPPIQANGTKVYCDNSVCD